MAKAKSGSFRHLAYIMKNASTSLNEDGRPIIDPSTHATVKCSLVKLTGTERQIAQQIFGVCSHELRCWFVPGVTGKMWIEALNGKKFNIVDVDDIEEKNFELRIMLNSETS